MNKLFLISILTTIAFTSTTYANTKTTQDPLNFEGTFQCKGFDAKDGKVSDITTFTRDDAASDRVHNIGAYTFKGKTYSGYATVQGHSIGYYFENNDHNNPVTATDHGIGVATLTHTQNEQGKFITEFHGAYFQPEYQGNPKNTKDIGSHGTGYCVKVEG